MYRDSEKELDKIFMSYNKILLRFKSLNIKTKNGKEITHKDLRKAISVMVKKHPTCRWQSEKIRSKKYYISISNKRKKFAMEKAYKSIIEKEKAI